jgi:hypothetical protein
VSEAAPVTGAPDHSSRDSEVAKAFVSGLPVGRPCVFLTLAPWSATKSADARVIAQALNLDLIAPNVAGLNTIDGDHLDRASAERWSAAFFEAAGPRLRECLRAAPVEVR